MPNSSSTSVTVNLAEARRIFLNALALAESASPLPEEWTRRVLETGEASSKTFVALLGTALLARATEPRVDPLVVHKSRGIPSPGFLSYQPRSVGHSVLVPLSFEHGVHLGRVGREPLNNQPVYGSSRVEDFRGRMRASGAADVERLITTLERVRELTTNELLPALATFIRERQVVGRRERTARLAESEVNASFQDVGSAALEFINVDTEGGRRGQAMVAAALDLVFDRVEAGGINDPSRHWPGDVHVFSKPESIPILVVEVRQKTVRLHDIHAFLTAVAGKQVRKAMVVALAPRQDTLDASEASGLTQEYGVLLHPVVGVQDFLLQVALWSGLTLDEFTRAFPSRMLDRLIEFDSSDEGQAAWRSRFST